MTAAAVVASDRADGADAADDAGAATMDTAEALLS
jgi:hypothetical protein